MPTANAERRGAQPKLENQNLARARPAEAGKPGLSGLLYRWCGRKLLPYLCLNAGSGLGTREGGFGGRSRKMLGSGNELRLQIIKKTYRGVVYLVLGTKSKRLQTCYVVGFTIFAARKN